MRGQLKHAAPVLRVAHLERSIEYYCTRLAFAVEFRYEDFYASVVRDGCRLHLKCAPPPVRDPAEFQVDEHIDVNVAVENVAALASEFAQAGAAFSVELRRMPYGQEFYVRDPDGYILSFVQPQDSA